MIREKHFTPMDLKSVNPINVCANSECERPIYKGDQVWAKGKDLYCHLGCFVESIKK